MGHRLLLEGFLDLYYESSVWIGVEWSESSRDDQILVNTRVAGSGKEI